MKKISGIKLFCFLFLPLILWLFACSNQKKDEKVPVIYITDLYHPHHDLDDHFDLVAMYAVEGFDIKSIIIDYAEPYKTPGIKPIEQMNYITHKNIPVYLGLKENLKTPDDKALWQKENQEGCKQIIKILKESSQKVTIFTVGSLRDLAATYNREPDLFKEKVNKMVLFIGEANRKDFIEYNVNLDKNAFNQIMNHAPNIYWVPCFDGGLWQNNGRASFWRAHHANLLKNASSQLINFFLYAILKEPDSVNHINYLNEPINQKKMQEEILDSTIPLRSLWCCSVFQFFSGNKKSQNLPFAFEQVRVQVNDSAILDYTPQGNLVNRFYITDKAGYDSKMTTTYNKLINSFKTMK
jgi:hypothetical protein